MRTRSILLAGLALACLASSSLAGEGFYRGSTSIGNTRTVGLAFPPALDVLMGGEQLSFPSVFQGSSTPVPATVENGSIRICTDTSCTVASEWSSSVDVEDGDILQIRVHGPTEPFQSSIALVKVMGETVAYEATASGRPARISTFSPSVAEPAVSVESGLSTFVGWVSAPITVTGGEYRVCSSRGACGSFTSAAGTVRDGDQIQLRVMSGTFSERRSTSVSAAGATATWTTTTRDKIETPAVFSLGEPVVELEPNTRRTTSPVVLSGFDDAPISVSGTGVRYALNGGSLTSSPGTARAGDSIVVEAVSGPAYGDVRTSTVVIGGRSVSLELRNRTKDIVPDAFSLGPDLLAQEADALVVSQSATLQGFEDAPISIEGTGAEYALNGGSFTTVVGTAKAGDTLRLRIRTGAFGEIRVATLRVGGTTATWQSTVRQKDTVPNPFSFSSVTGAPTGSTQTSQVATLSGFDDATVSIAGGTYSLNGGPFVSTPGTARSGDQIRLQLQAGAVSETRTATVSVGGASAGFSVIARAADATPDAFSFASRSSAEPSTTYVSPIASMTGHDPISVSISGGNGSAYQVCSTSNCSDQGSNWVTGTTSGVQAGSYVRVRTTASPTLSGSTSTTLSAGTANVSFAVYNRAGNACYTPWGSTVGHGGSVTAYQSNTASSDYQCSQYAQTRTCNDGSLSGSGSYSFCEVPRTVAVTCTSTAGNTRTVYAYAAGQDPLSGRAPSNQGTWVIFRSGRALNCDDANNYPYNQDINNSSYADSQTCRNYGGSGTGTYLHSCYWN